MHGMIQYYMLYHKRRVLPIPTNLGSEELWTDDYFRNIGIVS